MSSINSLASSLLDPTLFQNLSSNAKPTAATSASSAGASDSNNLSPFAQLLSNLQQLQQSDPAKYQAVTGQISAKLTSAAQQDAAKGDTTGAANLTKLAADFSSASTNGTLPNIQDLASSVGAGHHHHHGHHSAPPASSSSDSESTASTTSSNTLLNQLQAYSNNFSQNSLTDPLSIISSTLSGSAT